jgi:Holliday junction resolvase-like predicted endonuclease
MSREELRFMADVAARPLSTTVSRYQRLNLSRRKGNAVRQHLAAGGLIEATTIATRSGQVVLYQLTDHGRSLCEEMGIAVGPALRASLEHQFWAERAAAYLENEGYEVTREYPVPGDGIVDLLAERPGVRVVLEVETGKSDIQENIAKLKNAAFDRIILLATCPEAVSACQKAIAGASTGAVNPVELLTWLDLGA